VLDLLGPRLGRLALAAVTTSRPADWELEPGPSAPDVGRALAVGAGGRPVVFVPAHARVARRLRSILVLHEGSPSATAGVDAASEVAVATGAEVVVLHVPAPEPSDEHGSLPAPRVVDHGPQE
jgi:hypothetical protein